MVDVNDVSDLFIALYKESDDPMTNIRINKFLYFAQAWHLALYNKPLFDEDFQAWKKGPVLPSVYQKYKSYVADPITEIDNKNYMESFTGAQINLLIAVAKKYGALSNQSLVGITHRNGPWKEVYRENENNVIPKDMIRKHFRGMADEGHALKVFDVNDLDKKTFVGYIDDDGYTVLPGSMDD